MSLTNIALNSRSMNGQIVLSDGVATISEGDIECDDINSNSLTTNQINATVLTVTGEVRCNLNGPLSIPTSISSLTGLLISYGNTTNSGATDFTNFGSTYTTTQQGFRFFNKSNVQTLTNLAIIDNTQTFFSSPLTGCLAESPVSANSVANRSYVDNNFVDRVNNLTQNINGLKTFTNNIEIFNATTPSLILSTSVSANNRSIIRQNGTTSLSINSQNPASSIIFQINSSACLTINNSQILLPASIFLTTNDMKSRSPTTAHTLLSDISTGTLAISSATATNTINGATQLNQQTTFNNFTPISSVATPTAINHLTRKDYVDGNFLDRTNNLTQSINGAKTFSSIVTCSVVPVNPSDLTNKSYVDGMPVHQILNTDNVWTGLNEFNKTITFKQNLGTPSSTIKQIGNNMLINNLTNSGQMILNMLSSTGTPRDILTLDFTQMTLQLVPLTIKYATLQYTELDQTAQAFSIQNKSVGGNIRFECRTAGGTDTSLATFNTTGISIGVSSINNSISGPTTFNQYASLSLTPVAPAHIINKSYADANYCDLLNAQSIAGIKTFSSFPRITGTPTQSNELINKSYADSTFLDRVNNSTQSINGSKTFSENVICSVTAPTAINHLTRKDYVDSNFVDRVNNSTQSINGLKTFTNNLTCSASLISNNITAPSSTIAGVNNIYTNLDPNGLGVINIGAYGNSGNNINIKCPLNIVESYYGTTPTKITTINQEGNNCRFTNNGSSGGTYIFTMNESGTFNPLVINKTSIDIAGNANVSGNLILYDTTPSTKTITTGLVGNDLTFNPNNTVSTTYNFKTNDSVNNTTTPVTISSNNITINTNITHNQAQLLNKVKVISGTSATLTLPLEQTLMFSSTGATNITITMPELNQSYHAGFTFHLIKTGSNTNSVVFNRAGSNLLRGYGSITGATTYTSMINTDTIINVYTLEVSIGNFEWIFY